ncbi:hypothetical protein MBANPS3_009661 [Mucor bainieri]
MAVPRDCLPAEVWLNVFDHIQDKKQLAQCKLVCKRWAPLAEMAMLKTVVLPRNSTRKLYQHLLKNPRSSQYIQVVDIPNYTSEDLSNIRNVLTMAMTPSPKEIGADILAKEILGIVVDIAAQMPSDNLKLERMPIVTFENDAYAALVYQLRKTLRSLSLAFLPESRLDSIRRIFCNLGHFQSLTTLSLFDRKVYLDSVSMVDDLLKGCPHLKTLSLGIDMSTRRKAHHQGNLDAWLLKNVQQVHCMKEVSLQNIKDNSLSVGYGVPLLPQGYTFLMQIEKEKEANHTKLALQHIPWDVPVKGIVLLIISLFTTLTRDFEIRLPVYKQFHTPDIKPVDFLKWTPFIKNLKIRSEYLTREQLLLMPLKRLHTLNFDCIHLTMDNLYNIASWAPYLKHLTLKSCKFATTFLASEELSDQNARLPLLHTLELDCTNLTTKGMGDIVSWVPHLKNLTLKSSKPTVDERYDFDGFLYQEIALPELDLITLSVKGDMLSQDLYISVASARFPPQLFYAAPSQPTVRTTQEEHELYTHTATSIAIECKSLKHLSVNLNDVVLEMKFDEEGNVIESKPATVNSKMAQLQQKIQALTAKNASLKTENQAVTTKYKQAKKHLTEAQIQTIEKQDL